MISISMLAFFLTATGLSSVSAANMTGGHHKQKSTVTMTKQKKKQARFEKKQAKHTRKNTSGAAQ